jgi:diguanylate cyclase (GGDEF)-like protein
MAIVSSNSRRRIIFFVLSLVLTGIFGAWDYVSDPDLSLLIFYLLPLFLAIWFVGDLAGFGIFLGIGIILLLDDIHSGHSYSHPALSYWNLGVKLAFFALILAVLSRLKKALRREQDLARIDPLTEVFNARHFDELAEMEIHRSERYHHSFTLAFMDVDNFKRINDEFGHSIGDSLLKVLAKTLQHNIRNTDILARLGGDEFALLMPETGPEGCQFALRRFQKNLMEAVEKNGWSVTVSLGAVTFLTPPPSVDAALSRADHLMYRAKQAGKNQIKFEVWEESTQRKRV